jgi:hypothetical protein
VTPNMYPRLRTMVIRAFNQECISPGQVCPYPEILTEARGKASISICALANTTGDVVSRQGEKHSTKELAALLSSLRQPVAVFIY